ncbi:MAG: tetratricopeptide repeat protein [Candidatus Muiribacteriota bacterium]
MISKNYIIASDFVQKNFYKDLIIGVYNKDFNFETGQENILDIYVFSKKHNLLDWVWGAPCWNDREIEFPIYTWEFLDNILNNVFNIKNKVLITDHKELPRYMNWKKENKQPAKKFSLNLIESFDNYSDYNIQKKLARIYLIKIQLFLNYMDTDSIPMYLKNIGVLYNELNLYNKALFFLKKALRLNNNCDIKDETGITLIKLKKYKIALRFLKNSNTRKAQSCLAYSYKMTGDLEKALNILKKLYDEQEETWIKNDIEFIKNELDKKN